MRLTQKLYRQHIGWHFGQYWNRAGKKRIQQTGADKILSKYGVKIEDPNKFIQREVVYEKIDVIGVRGLKPNGPHPNYHERTLLTYEDNNVLLEGLTQAKILTNTVEVQEGLPEKYQIEDISRELNQKVKKLILGSHIFDAEQKKLPIVKDPLRPAWNFPRTYGITQERVFKLLINKLINAIENYSELDIVKQRYLTDNLYFQFPFEKYGNLIQFQLCGDIVVLSRKPLSSITNINTQEFELPNMDPISPINTLNKRQNYILQDVYPITKGFTMLSPHTLFINFNKENVKNLFEEEVTEHQIQGRNLMKSFTAAAAYAKAQFGNHVKELPTPVTLQSIQTDGRLFHFGVLQLNTLDLDNSEIRNIWYQTPILELFNTCSYQLGKPVLDGYNKSVVNTIAAFYNNN